MLLVIWIGSYVNQFIPVQSWAICPAAFTEGFIFILGIIISVVDLAELAKSSDTAHPDTTDKPGPSSPAPVR